ncbi:MAG: MopE-related protein [Myxococcota bacterium]
MRHTWFAAALALAVGCKDSDVDGVRDGQDCAPDDHDVFPGASEVCDGVDNDCDGQVDEDVATLAYWDRDRDGFGDEANARRVCAVPDDGATVAGDCDDLDPKVNPGAAEACNLADDDCDGAIDEDAEVVFYADADGDGHGVPGDTTTACFAPEGYAGLSDDCDDAEPLAWTGAAESCDGVDNDCDGATDEDLEPVRVWTDADGDGYGDPAAPALACGAGVGVADNALDCDDADPNHSPDTIETRMNDVDDDCDGYVNELGVGPGNEFATVADALPSAAPGEVVQIDQGLHVETVDLRGHDVVLAGEGCDRTTLYGDDQGTTVRADRGQIERLTVSGGTGSIADFTDANLYGGGVLIEGPVALVDACVVGNSATRGGGIAVLSGVASLDGVVVDQNTSSSLGAGVYVIAPGAATAVRSRIVGNTASDWGGGIASIGASLDLTNTVIAGNVALTKGCGLYAEEAVDPGTAAITAPSSVFDQVTFHANRCTGTSARNGEAIYQAGGALDLHDALFTDHPEPYVVVETTDGNASLALPTLTKSYVGYHGNAGPDADYESFQQDRIGGDPAYVSADPTVAAPDHDLRLRPGSAFVDVGDPAVTDPDGTPTDLGAYGGPSAGPGWDFGLRDDEDGDGILSGWEVHAGTNQWLDDAGDDEDGDGLTNLDEYAVDADPFAPDTDDDGISDGIELGLGTDPTLAFDQAPTVATAPFRYGFVGEPLAVDASASFDPNADPLSFGWVATVVPPTSVATFADPAADATTFTPDLAGDYVLTVTVDDGSTTRSVDVAVTVFDGAIVPDDQPTVQAAIDAVFPGQAVAVRPGTWVGAFDTRGGSVVVLGLGAADEVVLDGGGGGSTVTVIGGDFTAAHLTLTGGYSDEGGGLHADAFGFVELDDVVITGNYAVNGGGLWANGESAKVALRGSRVTDNVAEIDGGGLWITGDDIQRTLDVFDGAFVGNRAGSAGGALWLDGGPFTGADADFYLSSVAFLDNAAPIGAAWRHTGQGSDVNAWNVTFVANRGGSLTFSNEGRSIVLSDAIAGNAVSVLWDGALVADQAPIEYQHFDGVWTDLPATLWFADAGLAATLPSYQVADPRIGVFTDDGDPTDDLVATRLGSPAIDAGFLDHLDRDGTRADVGACGGPYADPACGQARLDADGDGMSDRWEREVGLDPTVADGSDDADGDGLDALTEHQAGTRADEADSDSDGLTDAVELGGVGDPLDDRDHRPQVVVGAEFLRFELGDLAVASATASYDPDGQPITGYHWALIGVASGSAITPAALSGDDTAAVSFTPDVAGAYRLRVTVDAGGATSRPVTVWVYVPRVLTVPDDYATVDEAFSAASPYDTIHIGAGTWPLTFDPGQTPITIAGDGAGVTVLEGIGSQPIVNLGVNSRAELRDLTLARGANYQGGAITCSTGSALVASAELVLERVTATQNVAFNGGVVYGFNCALDLRDVTFTRNFASNAGGAMNLTHGSLTWTGGSLDHNTAGANGGGITMSSGTATITNVLVHRNSSVTNGAAIQISGSDADGDSFTADHLTVAGNYGTLGAVFRPNDSTLPFTVTNCLFYDNGRYALYDGEETTPNWFTDHNGFWNNTIHSFPSTASTGPTDVKSNPSFVGYDGKELGIIADDLHLRDDSPMRDAGVGAADPDGSLADIGVYGGPGAPVDWDVYFRDLDSDGMSDGYETDFGLDPALDDAALDPDGDTLTNLAEAAADADPFSVDTDVDGVDDPTEVVSGDDPADPLDNAPDVGAGIDVAGTVGSASVLSATADDPQNDPVTFAWTLTEKPGRSLLTSGDLGGADTATVILTPDTPGTYVLSLVGSDGAGYSEPDTVEVNVAGDVRVPEDYPTLKAAVEGASTGAAILVGPGTFPTRIDLEGKNLTLIGAGRDLTVLDGQDLGPVIIADDAEIVALDGLTLTGGRNGRGGGLWSRDGDVTLTDVALADNLAAEGAGLYADTSVVVADGVRVVDNFVGYRGAGIALTGTGSSLDVVHGLFAGNSAPEGQGGAIRANIGVATVRNAIFSDNYAKEGAGVFVVTTPSSAVLSHVTATFNSGDLTGTGAFFRVGDQALGELHDAVVTQNRVTYTITEYESLTSAAAGFVQTYSLVANNDKEYLLADSPVPVDGVDGNDLVGPADLTGLIEDGDWTNDDWTLGAASSAIDAGDPAGSLDPDGSAPDMGAFGGADGDWVP